VGVVRSSLYAGRSADTGRLFASDPCGVILACVPELQLGTCKTDRFGGGVQFSGMRYTAFISYRHIESDRRWAKWLHVTLESYRIPKSLRKAGAASGRLGRVFRDEEELAASSDLSREVTSALEDSRYLLVVCSPSTPASRWVNEEIKQFAKLGRQDNILALLTAGEPEQSFPPAMSQLGVEPLAADVRDGSRHGKRDAELRIVATLLGCRFDDLRQREQERRLRRAMALLAIMASASILFAMLAVVAVVQLNTAKSRQLAVSSLYVLNDDPELAVMLATEGISVRRTGEAEEALREAMLHFGLRHILKGHKGGVERATFTPDGKRIATGGDDGTVRIWNTETGAPILVIQAHKRAVNSVAFSPDGWLLVTASGSRISETGGRTVRVWDAGSGKLLHELKLIQGYAVDAKFSHDGKFVVTADSEGFALVWDASSGKLKMVLQGHAAGLTHASFAPDDRSVFTSSSDWKAAKWDLASGRPVRVYLHHSDVYGLALSADGKFAATAERGYAQVESAMNLKPWCEIRGHDADHDVLDVAFSPDGRLVATAGSEGVSLVATIGALPPSEGFCPVTTLSGHNGSVNKVIFTPNGESVLTASDDHTARVWDSKTGRLVTPLLGHAGIVNDVDVSGDGRYAVTASADGTARIWQINATLPRVTLPGEGGILSPARFQALTWQGSSVSLWDIRDGHQILKLDGQTGNVIEAAFSANGDLALTASEDGTARVWDGSSGKLLRTFRADMSPLTHATFSHDGNFVAVVSQDNVGRVWNVNTGKLTSELRGHTGFVNSIMFSSDSGRLVTASEDHTVRIWNTVNGSTMLVYRGHAGPVRRASFTADGERVVSVSPGTGNDTTREWNNEPVRIWNARTGADIFHLLGHNDAIEDAILSGDGKLVVTSSYDRTARVWDATTGVNLSELRGHIERIDGATFSPDGNFVATVGGDCDMRVWDARSGRILLVFAGNCFGATQFSPDGALIMAKPSRIPGIHTGTVDILSCEVCIDTDKLLTLERERVKRSLLASERDRYLR